ncbi:MAG: DegT/DnrJ/EryC1/StrS family aminotransferase [Dissulfurimicrobium sp.]|uniref:DegT/DnrJ/EryC1/StrS family aminotransferase n=1 Tax=Dissulfurimicrobium sp. TaxID=2022436 RepID=UPI00404AB870
MKFIDLNRQYNAYKDEIDEAIRNIIESGQFVLGGVLEKLEAVLARYVGVRHAIGVSSGTDALLIALMAYGIGHGDEVITTPFTFIATAEAICLVGAKPVFTDIDPVTYNMDVVGLESVIKERKAAGARLRAIIPVSLYGQCPDMDEINQVAKAYGLHVIEDACQSFGARYKGRMSCALSDIGVTSFFPSKPLGAYGDGGMVFTDDDEIAKRCFALRVHGQTRPYYHKMIGLNARLDAIQSGILLVKFAHLEEELEKREKVARFYTTGFKESVPIVITPFVQSDRTSVYSQYTIRLPNGRRDKAVEFMKGRGIPVAIHYPRPIHLQPAFKHLGLGPGSLPHSEKAAREVMSLPMHPFISKEEQIRVIEAVKEALEQ